MKISKVDIALILALSTSVLFSAQVYADRNLALTTQSNAIIWNLSQPSNFGVCRYTQTLGDVLESNVDQGINVEIEALRNHSPDVSYHHRRLQRLMIAKNRLVDLRRHNCLDISSLVAHGKYSGPFHPVETKPPNI